jgi:hypothetical protein
VTSEGSLSGAQISQICHVVVWCGQTRSADHIGGYLRVGTHQVLVTECHWAAPLLFDTSLP